MTIPRPLIEQVTEDLPLNLDVADYERRPIERIRLLVVHHTGADPMLEPAAIARRHTELMEWPGMGYHYYIRGDGRIYQCERLTTISYHTHNLNGISAGIAFAGAFNNAVPPPAQIAAGAGLLAWLLGQLNLHPKAITGHCELRRFHTACPGDQWVMGERWKDMLMAEVRSVVSIR